MISVRSSRKIGSIKTIIGNNPHCEICKDIEASYKYCTKAESRVFGPWEHGSRPAGQGKRTDLAKIWSDVKSKKRTMDMLEEDPAIAKFEKHIKFMRFTVQERDSNRQDGGVKVWVFYGDTNLGKTYAAVNLIKPHSMFKMDPPPRSTATLWFDGYEGQELLVMDEFEGENYCPLSKLKSLLDVYPCRLDVKGSFTWAAWNHVILCSNTAPRHWYPVAPSQPQILAPLVRRITEIRHFVERGKYVLESWDGEQLGHVLDVECPPTRPQTPASPIPVLAGTAAPGQEAVHYPEPLPIPDFTDDDDGLVFSII